MDITTITYKWLDNVVGILHNIPNKIYGYNTSNEVWVKNV